MKLKDVPEKDLKPGMKIKGTAGMIFIVAPYRSLRNGYFVRENGVTDDDGWLFFEDREDIWSGTYWHISELEVVDECLNPNQEDEND